MAITSTFTGRFHQTPSGTLLSIWRNHARKADFYMDSVDLAVYISSNTPERPKFAKPYQDALTALNKEKVRLAKPKFPFN